MHLLCRIDKAIYSLVEQEIQSSDVVITGRSPFVAPYFKDTSYLEIEMEKAVFANVHGYYERERVARK